MTTPNLGLTELAASQSQPEVPLNLDLLILDAVVQLTVKDKDLAAPPGSPAAGDRYIIASPATGVWAGQEGKLAAYMNGGWQIITPLPGWTAYVQDEALTYQYGGGSPAGWTTLAAGSTLSLTSVGSPGATVPAVTSITVDGAVVSQDAAGAARITLPSQFAGITVLNQGSPGASVPNVSSIELVGAVVTGSPTDSARAIVTVEQTPAQVVTDSTAARNADPSDAGKYIRFTNAGTKTYTFNGGYAYTVGQEFNIRNVGAGALTLVQDGGMILNAPYLGTLVVPAAGTATIKIVAAPIGSPSTAEADVIGVTVPA